jgi:hypothetical protein
MNLKHLKARHPYMFAGENIGLSFHRGWFPVFAQLCEDIAALLGPDKRGFHWVQLKEKFGSARYYWEMDQHEPNLRLDLIGPNGVTSLRLSDLQEPGTAQPSLARRIDELVRAAEDATRSMCIVCGQPATLNHDQAWILALCVHHAGQRRLGKLEPAWFPDEEQQ